jgi:serine/threonine protein kinase
MKQLGHYQLLRVLGEGGMGIVYLAEDLRLKREVAVKFIKPDKQDSKSNKLQARLQREATMLAQLNHPNIVQIYDTVDDQNKFTLAMKSIDGCSLDKQLREQVAGVKQRLIWLQQIAEGLSAAHSKGLIHSDLKAENIIINKQ